MTPAEAREALGKQSYSVEDKRPEREYFIVTCPTCHARWSLGIRQGRVHGGNMLALLDHAAGHKENKDHALR